MKLRFFYLILLLAAYATTFSQIDYRVIKVNGTITIQSSGTNLATGIVFSDQENLLFKTTTSKAAVINGDQGRFVITPSNKDDLLASKSNYAPGLSNISSRSGSSSALKNTIDIKNYFSGKFLVFDSACVVIQSDEFQMNDKKYFYFRYKYNDETINKRLSYKGDTLIVDRKELLTIDGNVITEDMVSELMLMYYIEDEKKSIQISSFEPVFANELIKQEIGIILEEMKDSDYEAKIDAILSYLNEFYGKPDKENLEVWLKSNFSITK